MGATPPSQTKDGTYPQTDDLVRFRFEKQQLLVSTKDKIELGPTNLVEP